MKIAVFDTETTSLNKPFCYNIGYVIVDTEDYTDSNEWKILVEREFVIEQVWHNLPLFSTAYYAEKRPLYISAMRAKTAQMVKFGYATQQMIRDFKVHNVEIAFAYNSDFDERVFNFNCDWFKVINPFDDIPIHDIRAYFMELVENDNEFFQFCEDNERFTESGNYSTTAETAYQYFTGDCGFEEDHTALSDSYIETYILECCSNADIDITKEKKAKKSIEREQEKTLTFIDKTSNTTSYYKCKKITYYKKSNKLVIK